MKNAKRLISAVLVITMLLCMFPAGIISASAAGETVITHDVDEIRDYLRNDDNVTIKLDADANKELTAYSDFETEKSDLWDNSQYIWTKIGQGDKILDLNGHRLYVYDRSASELGSTEWLSFRYIQKALMFEIPEGASVTVNDATGKGLIWMDSEMPAKTEMRGNNMLMERNIFGVTGGNLTVNGGEIHAGRSKEIYANQATEYDTSYRLIANGSLFGVPMYKDLCGYATWFLSGTAITAKSGNVTINGGDIWGRGWDNFSIISRVSNNPNGADDHRDRCAAVRVQGDGKVNILSGSFHGRSDADAVQVNNPSNLSVKAGSFDVGTNSWLVIPNLDHSSAGIGSVSQILHDDWFGVSPFNVHQGNIGSAVIPPQCVDSNSNAISDSTGMLVYPISQSPSSVKVISDIGLYLNSPLADESPASKNEIYNVPAGATVESVSWYQNGTLISDPSVVFFNEGDSYSVKINLAAKSGTLFRYGLSDAFVNGKQAVISRRDDRHITLTAPLGICIKAIQTTSFTVSEPECGRLPDYNISSASDTYTVLGRYDNYTSYRRWFVSDNGTSGWALMDLEDSFEAGKYYRLSFDIRAEEGQEFAVSDTGASIQPGITAKVNGKTAKTEKGYEQDPSRDVTVTYDFGKCPSLIENIELITDYCPVDGETVHYTVTTASDSYYVVGQNSSNYDDYVKWYVSDSGEDDTWTLMGRTSKFEAGKYYRLYADVHTSTGYEFMTRDLGSVEPYVYPTVNGYYANVNKAYEQDPHNYVTVVYDFGCCNDSVVEDIIVTDVTAPVAGENPSYCYNISGSGYLMDLSRNAYYDDYMHNQKIYYVKNGISWWDTTSGSDSEVYENDVFISGHTYRCQVCLVSADNYRFRNMTEDGSLPNAFLNGMTAEVIAGWTNATEARISYTFTCAKKDISEVNLSGIDRPAGGSHPDLEIDLDDSALYRPDPNYGINGSGIYWYDCEGNMLEAEDTFRAGERYKIEVKLIPTQNGGVNDSGFVTPFTAYVNGEQVEERLDWDSAYANANVAYVYYTFIRAASAPETEPSQQAHSHNLVFEDAKAAKCNQSGNTAYYYCTECGKWFEDANANSPITDKSDVIIPATGNHSYDAGVVTEKPTCSATGIRTYTCTVCGATRTESIAKTEHSYNSKGICTECSDWKYKTGKPKLVSVTNAKNGITVKWSALTGAKGYYVYRKTGSEGWKKIATITGISYTDTSAKVGTKYTYTVKAYTDKAVSKYNTTGLTTIRLTNPSVKLANTKDGIKVSWGKVTGAKGYYVYRKSGSEGYKKIATTAKLSYVDKTAKAGTKYTYTVKAYNGSYASAYTGVVIIRLTNPSVKLTNTKSGPKATWGKVKGAKGYYIYRKTASGSYAKIATVKSAYYVDKTAKKNVKYYYAVRAYNGSYKSAYTNNGITCKK